MPQSTHHLEIGAGEVVKRFRSSDRGEADREWAGLRLLARHAPGVGPTPLRFEPSAPGEAAPSIAMSRVAGSPLGSAPLSPEQTAAVGRAHAELFAAVPHAELADFPERRSGPRELASELRAWIVEPHEPCGPVAEAALDAARAWIESAPVAALTDGPLADPVLGLGDGNIGNFLWDGQRCRVVDFEDCGVSDPTYEVADVVEHATVSLPGLLDPAALVATFGFDADQARRLLEFRRLMATFWLLMLLPGNPAHARNPAGSLNQQAGRALALLDAER
jgi:Ser/Thr protein kinase RdoA (MazF antagonist)